MITEKKFDVLVYVDTDAMKSGDVEHIYDITIQHMERPKGINLEDL